MFLFLALLLTLILLIAFVLITISIFGAGFIVVFGDVIVCIAIIVFLIKKIFFRKKNKTKKR